MSLRVLKKSKMAQQVEEAEEYDFVEPLSEDFICRVCLQLLQQPQLTTCCGQHYCKSCLDRVRSAKQPCPLCKQGFDAVIDKSVERRIKSLLVNCRNKDRGCDWVGELRSLSEHLDPKKNRCKFNVVECPKGCGQMLIHDSRQIEHHITNECPKRKVICQYCEQASTYEEINTHRDNCESFPVVCPNRCSSDRFPRSNLPQHLQQCRLHPIECEFANVGCSMRVPRKDLAHHMQESTQRHLGMMSRFCMDLMQALQVKERQIAEVELEVAGLRETLRQVQADLVDQKRVFEDQRWVFEERFGEKEQQLLQLQLQMDEQPRLLRGDQYATKIQLLETLVSVPPYYFTLTNFALHKRGTTQWMCPPFHTELGGYKMAIEISANGEGAGKGSHVSVYIRIMRGEYDDRLLWPLRASVTVQLISQRNDGNDYEMSTPYYEWARVTDGVVGVGWGWDKFVPHTELEVSAGRRTEYLKNDRLNFRVISVDRAY